MKTKADNIDGMNKLQRVLKRIGDCVGACAGLLLFSPLLVIICIILKIDSKGSVIYRQERIGRGGTPFYILKFRTMIEESEIEGIPQLAQKDDTRQTRIGRFLREHHIDELPQLWNVLVGDMSFVGYRPERSFFINKIMEVRPDYQLLYVSRPGVTSYATLYNGYTDTLEKMLHRLDMDLDYLRHRSIILDLKIILATLTYVGGIKNNNIC